MFNNIDTPFVRERVCKPRETRKSFVKISICQWASLTPGSRFFTKHHATHDGDELWKWQIEMSQLWHQNVVPVKNGPVGFGLFT